jgi:subtilisin family serine protease
MILMMLLNKRRLGLFVLLVLALFSAGGERVRTQGPAFRGAYVEDELLVKLKPAASVAKLLDRNGLERLREFPGSGWQLFRLPQGLNVDAAVEHFQKLPEVAAAQPNFVYHAQANADDPRFGDLYGLNKIQAPLAWDTTTGGPNVVVAVIDLGIDYNHEDLSANMWRNPGESGTDQLGRDKATNGVDDDGNGYSDDVFGIDTINRDSDPLDDSGHGTHVAGTIGAVGNNSKGVVGVNWTVRLMALKTHDAAGNGTSASVVEAFRYAALMRDRGINIRVTNSSWGGSPEAPSFDQALKDAIDGAGEAGILNVCAAGNGNNNNDTVPFYPATYDSPSIISVAASDQNDNKVSFSSYGATTVDLAAPGLGILSTLPGTYGSLSGTSMSTPHVSGAAALLCAYNPHLSLGQLKAAILNTVDSVPQWSGLSVTGGRLNLSRALQSIPTSNQIDSAEFFVRQQYLDFLGREPDPGGQSFWTNEINRCGNDQSCVRSRRIGVSAAFFIEMEFQQTGSFVIRLYRASFGRRPSFTEFITDRSMVTGAPNPEQLQQVLADQWVARASFQQVYPLTMTAEQFVNRLFDTAQLIPFTVERQQQIDSMINQGKTRAEVLRSVIEIQAFKNREFNPAFVLMQYFGYLRRDPEEGGYLFWLEVLDNREPNNYRSMVCAFLTSAEYQLRFAPVVSRTNAECGE